MTDDGFFDNTPPEQANRKPCLFSDWKLALAIYVAGLASGFLIASL